MGLSQFVANRIRKHVGIVHYISKIAHKASPETVILLDYPIEPKPRWTIDHPHPVIFDIIDSHRDAYKQNLCSFLSLSSFLSRIPARQENSNAIMPHWDNSWLPPLDAVALYGFLVKYRPKVYMEVGSGNSTKFAYKAISDHGLDTKILSIDPCPRAEIDKICDEVIRKPVEQVDVREFDRLEKNDILFIDNSHRVFMNSDVTTIFLDVLPRLKPGVIVQIHDILLPYDYPDNWADRYYSEQYLLAAYLLANNSMFDIVLPNMFINNDNELRNILEPLWRESALEPVKKFGYSFWIRMK